MLFILPIYKYCISPYFICIIPIYKEVLYKCFISFLPIYRDGFLFCFSPYLTYIQGRVNLAIAFFSFASFVGFKLFSSIYWLIYCFGLLHSCLIFTPRFTFFCFSYIGLFYPVYLYIKLCSIILYQGWFYWLNTFYSLFH